MIEQNEEQENSSSEIEVMDGDVVDSETEIKDSETEIKDSVSESTGNQDAVQDHINNITEQKHDALRNVEALKKKIVSMESAQPVKNRAPTIEDFDYNEDEFQQASIDYEVSRRIEIINQKADQEKTEKTRQKMQDGFSEKAKKFASKNPTYEAIIKRVPELHSEVLDVIFSLENGPDVAFLLGNKLDLADKISSLQPAQAAVQLGILSANIMNNKPETTVSNAPNPVKTLSGGGGVIKKNIADMSMEEIMNI